LVVYGCATFGSISAVAQRQARLVPGWVTVFGRLNRLGADPGIQVYSAGAIPLWVGGMSTQRNLGEVNRHTRSHPSLGR